MLKSLSLQGVGPAREIGPLEFGTRLNLLTGNNGSGKSFLLDVAWWALTGSWADRPAWPRSDYDSEPRIVAQVRGQAKIATLKAHFSGGAWVVGKGRPAMPGLVLYFRVDGRFALWDPAQHYWRRNRAKGVDDPNRPDALHFSPNELWNNVTSEEGKTLCRGLIEDWVTWQQTESSEFTALKAVLNELSPSSREKLEPGRPLRVWLDDIRLHPTLQLPYGTTPVTLASAGMQRVLMLAYLLIWAWHGHVEASKLVKQAPKQTIVVLFDEPETHLHPEWQRRILPSLLRAIQALDSDLSVQLFVSTHSPLVLASLEPEFSEDDGRDRLFNLALDESNHGIAVETSPFVKRGDTVNWLVSEVFGLEQARSVPAEQAIEAAERFMRGDPGANPPGLRTFKQIDRELLRVLGDHDPFWPRWIVKVIQT